MGILLIVLIASAYARYSASLPTDRVITTGEMRCLQSNGVDSLVMIVYYANQLLSNAVDTAKIANSEGFKSVDLLITPNTQWVDH